MFERRAAGELPDKPHTVFRAADGTLRHELCLTRAGFDGAFTISYHEHRPHLWQPRGAATGFPVPEASDEHALRRRHFRTDDAAQDASVLQSRVPLVFNDDVVVSVLAPSASDRVYFVNGDADDLFFVREGGGTLRSLYGDVSFGPGDYVCIPRGVMHRFELSAGTVQRWLGIECKAGLAVPAQYRNLHGQLRMDAPYSHRDLRSPSFAGPSDEGIRELIVKRSDRFEAFSLAHSPLDVVGWDGAVWPFAFAISRFAAKVGAVHLPPTAHATFALGGALVCSFVPRALDFGPNAIPCPYPHASVDVDELLYYCDGNFASRRGVGPGSVSLHPAGVPHGPQGDAYESSIGHLRTDELAVMLDCARPLRVTRQARALEDAGYHASF